MTEILNFPAQQKHHDDKKYTPEGVLEYVLEHMRNGDTSASTLIVSWVEHGENDVYSHRYMVGGASSLSDAVGLLEITKSSILST